jgi:hypothetical protein
MTSISSLRKAIAQAKSASQYDANHLISENECESNSKTQVTNTDDRLNAVQLIGPILDGQEVLSKQIQKNKEIQLNEKWDNPLENPRVVSRIDNLSSRLTEIAEEKDQILESLRNPIAENSISLQKENQANLVDSIKYLKHLSGNKDSNTINASWLEEQDWTLFGKKDLPVIETKILKLEAEIASELKECNIIKSISE